MQVITDKEFQDLINKAFDSLPAEHRDKVQNVAIVMAEEPTLEQRQQNHLRPDQTLLGLYEGVPLVRRQGMETRLPDKITLFKLPLLAMSADAATLQENIYHTLWHEIAHYYGLDHSEIGKLDKKIN